MFNEFDASDVSVMMGHKKLEVQYEEAAFKLQRWWKKRKQRAWLNIIGIIRRRAAVRL